MKIGIDVRHITDFGVGTYIRNVLRGLVRLDHENLYFLIGDPERVREIGELPPNFHVVPLPPAETALSEYLAFRRTLRQNETVATWCILRTWSRCRSTCPART